MENKTFGNIIYKNCVNITFASAAIACIYTMMSKKHHMHHDLNELENTAQLLVPLGIYIPICSALVYYAFANKNPQVLKQPIMYTVLCDTIISDAYLMYKNKDQPLNVIILGIASFSFQYIHYTYLITVCDLIE